MSGCRGPSPLGSRSFEGARTAMVNEELVRSERNHGHQTADSIDREVEKLIEEGLERAKEILEEHRDVVETLVKELLETQSLSGDRIRNAMGKDNRPTAGGAS